MLVPQPITPLPFLLGELVNVYIYLVGCGGTGSHLAASLVRLQLELNRQGTGCSLTFIDPDVVEEKNVPRQNFAPTEIGCNKAQALALRYGLAYGVEIGAIARSFSKSMLVERRDRASVTILVGAVDNAVARKEMAKVLAANDEQGWYMQKLLYLDCGNFGSGVGAGQVLLGSTRNFAIDAFKPTEQPSFCTALPCPTVQHPELLKDEPVGVDLSCAELAVRHAQALFVNLRVAAEAAEMLNHLLLVRHLTRYATYFNLVWGSARSEYICQENLEQYQSLSIPL